MLFFKSLRALAFVLALAGVGMIGAEVQAKPASHTYSANYEARGVKYHQSSGHHKGHFKHGSKHGFKQGFKHSKHRWGHRGHQRYSYKYNNRSYHRTYRYSRSSQHSGFKNRSFNRDSYRHASSKYQHRAPAGYWKRVYIKPVYEVRYDRHGNRYYVQVKKGYYKRVWVSGR